MFERFTEQARRTLFFARYEASQLGSVSIETEHLLLGLIREDSGVPQRVFANLQIDPQSVRKEIQSRSAVREKVSTSVEIPFSAEIKRIFQYAADEANRLRHDHIGTEHLLLGILREEGSVAATVLIERGMRLGSVRQETVSLKNSMDTEHGELEVSLQHATTTARYRIFESRTKSWEDLCEDATRFATEIGRERLINISVAASGGSDVLGHDSRELIVVWYWE